MGCSYEHEHDSRPRGGALLLTSEKGRKGIGFLLVAIFAPVILIAAILCSTTSGGADHNNSAVEASFYGVTYSEDVPDEFRTHIADMQTAFSFLDSAVAEANATMTDGNRLDPIQVKAIFYALLWRKRAEPACGRPVCGLLFYHRTANANCSH
ncbi:MAG: hypothetical protein ACLRXP_07680 [Oscillospiraceae bacterium]